MIKYENIDGTEVDYQNEERNGGHRKEQNIMGIDKKIKDMPQITPENMFGVLSSAGVAVWTISD